MMNMIFSWNTVWWLMLIVYVPCCIGLIIIVLLQKGKGVGFAGAFGAGGGSDAVFGPRSSKSLPQRITYSIAGLFMLLALLMSMLSGNVGSSVAPALVEETEMGSTTTTVRAGSLEALFSDGTTEEMAPELAPESATPAADVTTETPMPESTPETAAPAPEAAAPAEDAPVAPAAADAPATPETPAPADAPATPETPAPAEAPVAEAPAAQ